MTLRITLRDGEKMIVNGAVLRSVGRSDLSIENTVSLLRGREVMPASEATTPARRLYFACMLAYIDPAGVAKHQAEIIDYLGGLVDALQSPEAQATCAAIAHKVATSDLYRALADCRLLIAYETEVFARITPAAA